MLCASRPAVGDEGFVVGLEDVQCAGRAAIGQRVDEHQRVPLLEQVVGEVHAPDAVVDDLHVGVGWCRRATCRITSGPKPSSPRKMLPMPATRMRAVIWLTDRTYMFRIFMYRRTSGMERSPTSTPATTTTATTPVATQPITSIMNSYLGLTARVSSGSTSSGAKYR